MIGVFWILGNIDPVFVVVLLSFVVFVVHRLVIVFTEGSFRTLCLSESGTTGDHCLIALVGLASYVLHHTAQPLEGWVASWPFHVVTWFVALLIVVRMWFDLPRGRPTDYYHGLVIALLLALVVLPSGQLVLFSGAAQRWECFLGWFFVVGFLSTLVWDIAFNVLDQPAMWDRFEAKIPKVTILELWEKS